MRFEPPLIPGRLVRRYKRFLADIQLEDGREVTAHCANPGSMKTCLEPGGQVWLSPAQNPARKLKWTWQVARVGDAHIFVNPSMANEVVAEAIKAGQIPELSGYSLLRREVPYGSNSRIDFLLSGKEDCYVEVKNVTLQLNGPRAAFPDSVTQRGTKHLVELGKLSRRGIRSVLFFCTSRDDAEEVAPADAIDPVYGQALRQAKVDGVELLAYRCRVTSKEVAVERQIQVVLPALD